MKKAISPLISTVILIIFATVLGILVMGWGKNYDISPQGSCDDASLKLITLNGMPMACISDNIFYATIENDGQAIITGLKISAVGGIISATPIDLEIPVAAVTKIQISVDKPTKLIVTPKIQETLCPKKQLEVENIAQC